MLLLKDFRSALNKTKTNTGFLESSNCLCMCLQGGLWKSKARARQYGYHPAEL